MLIDIPFLHIKLTAFKFVLPPALPVNTAPSYVTYGCRYVDSLIAAEIEGGIPSERIMVGGFSQGTTQSKLWVYPSHLWDGDCVIVKLLLLG